jgi:hypothetical protein
VKPLAGRSTDAAGALVKGRCEGSPYVNLEGSCEVASQKQASDAGVSATSQKPG